MAPDIVETDRLGDAEADEEDVGLRVGEGPDRVVAGAAAGVPDCVVDHQGGGQLDAGRGQGHIWPTVTNDVAYVILL